MCSPQVIEKIAASAPPSGASTRRRPLPVLPAAVQTRFSHVVDMTHPIHEGFPSATGEQWLRLEDFTTFDDTGVNFRIWHLHEHLGTHIDAPIHFSEDGQWSEEIPVRQLVVPLAVIDIRARAAADPDTQVTPDDIRAWEGEHGPLPFGCCVAVNSGWDATVSGPGYRNVDEAGTMHFPGVHVEAAHMMMEDCDVAGLAVDTLSFDHGATTEYAAHKAWLPSGRWAVEGLAHPDAVPASGATLVVGGPTIVGSTGGPCRILALVDAAAAH